MQPKPQRKIERVSGLSGSARGWFIATLSANSSPILVISKDRTASESLLADTQFFLPYNQSPLIYPEWDVLPFESLSPSVETSAQRIYGLQVISSAKEFIAISSPRALLQRTIPIEFITQGTTRIELGAQIEPIALTRRLHALGYRDTSLVEQVGDIAVRGGVLDLFPVQCAQPIRLSFSGNQVIGIRHFSPESQRTISEASELLITPVVEFPCFLPSVCDPNFKSKAIEQIKKRALELETPVRESSRIIEALHDGAIFPGMEHFLGQVYQTLPSLFDFLPSNTTIVLDDEVELGFEISTFMELINQRSKQFEGEHRLIANPHLNYLSEQEFRNRLSDFDQIYLNQLNLHQLDAEPAIPERKVRTISNLELSTRLRSQIGSGKALAPLVERIEKLRNEGFKILFVVGTNQRAERLKKLLLEYDILAEFSSKNPTDWIAGRSLIPLAILIGSLSHGFQLPSEKIAFIAEREIFSDRSHKKGRATRSVKKYIASLTQLQPGDFIVHIDYGVGRYHGLMHRQIEGKGHDFLHLEYGGGSVLYLPVENIGKIQKYRAEEGRSPKLDKLGTTRWARAKAKVRESVVALAGDLIKLYATRKSVSGWRFEPPGAEDERFADGFGFDETSDQLSAIKDTLQDMSSPTPMDRLVCGDAGYGKTEVALRAAFKCTQHARQVAVLVPTTILVEQHKLVFQERFAGYPVQIGAISRFYKPAQNKETLSKLSNGEIDIIIGTHKLLQSGVVFKDLGLVVVDEEHRFGVKDKERLKQLRRNVDVLTLTATPIPRTLHMALLGIRDISIISTPPNDRKSIRTYVARYEDSVVRDAVLRELQRGGQCFYIHNKVNNISVVTGRLAQLVPEARMIYGHGQMNEKELEDVMLEFIEKKKDVLVSTTIVESGLDIPNANTILINNAHTFGLAQLYQLRGRVGRSTRQAYAYLLTPEPSKLGIDARKRLSVLQDMDELGLGFNLATKDLEIRGAGNLLGKNQSGHVEAVGVELYNRILKEAILNLKGEEPDVSETIDPELKIGVNAFIPESYIPEASERLILYQRLATISSFEEAHELEDEIEDRFGHGPKEVRTLVKLMRYRGLLRVSGIERAQVSGNRLVLTFHPRAKIAPERMESFVKSNKDKVRLSGNHSLSIDVGVFAAEDIDQLYKITEGLINDVTAL